MSRSREYRRSAKAKRIAYAKRRVVRLFKTGKPHEPWYGRQVTRYATDRVPCSCYMCGNMRKYWHLKTRQEYMSEEDFKKQLAEL